MALSDRGDIRYYRLKDFMRVALVDDLVLTREALIAAMAETDSSIRVMSFRTAEDCVRISTSFDAVVYYFRETRQSNLQDIALLRKSFPGMTIIVMCHITFQKMKMLASELKLNNLDCMILRPKTLKDLLEALRRKEASCIVANKNLRG